MKSPRIITNLVFIAASFLLGTTLIYGQVKQPPALKGGSSPRTAGNTKAGTPATEQAPIRPNEDDAAVAAAAADDPDAKEVLTYYNNYLKEYRLGPNDVISVEVFGQCPDYCVEGKTVPPTARISYPLIREGVMVGGKTVEQVADEITKKLDEYIIDPKVSVTLDKAMSVRYSVMGKVAQPGVRVLDRKVSVYEAILDSGGIVKGGDKKKVTVLSYNAQGKLSSKLVNLADMEKGKAEMVFLSPGDQVYVPSKGFTVETFFDYLGKASVVRFLFGSPF